MARSPVTRASCDGVALFAAGVGITPVRALLEDLPAGIDVVVVVRASTAATWSTGTRWPRWSGSAAVGSTRSSARGTRSGLARPGPAAIVPDIAYRDVYICGPDGFSADIADAALQLGTAPEQIHTEAFGF